jgi:hypothetical protein
MEARDLVAGDAGERFDRGAQDFLDVEGTADRLRDGAENLEVRLDVGAALMPRRRRSAGER